MENKSSRPLSILLLGTQMAVGGAQKVLLDQAGWFHKRGHKVFAVFFYDKENLQSRWQTASDFPIINLKALPENGGATVNVVLLVRGLFSLWRLLRKEKIDVIETFTHDSNMLALPVAWLARVPVRIATHHGVIENFPRWRERIHTWLINHNFAQTLVAVSSRIQEQALLEGINSKRVAVIKNGIAPLSLERVNRPEFRKEAGLKDEDLFAVSVGRLVYQKAHSVLIQAMPSVLKKYPNFKLGICGDGVLISDLEALILKLELRNSVKLLGKRDDVKGFLSAADIFVLPSRWEGLPIALLEAMSAGLPVVATQVEGVDEVVKDGEHGFLVPVENSEALADAILQLLDNRRLRREMGEAAKAHILEQYTEDIMCEQYFQIITKLLPPR
ncbi:MAG: glycosyltransferase family 4 protein [Chloroflexi bacterium]|nr:glycosyltransferase family 4 protein [Chloroflexota bacterium]